MTVQIRSKGRASRPLTKDELHELLEALWTADAMELPHYPTVLGSVFASYQDAAGRVIGVDSLERFLERYDERLGVIVTISGSLRGKPKVTLDYKYAGAEATLEVDANDQAAAQSIDEFRRRFSLTTVYGARYPPSAACI